MTLDEFLDELSKTPGPWKVWLSGQIRDARGACPINAVMRLRDDKHEQRESYMVAAETLGLRFPLARKIAKAADSKRCKLVRARLLAGLGLQEG